MLRHKIAKMLTHKKSAWELIESIPESPEQKKIDKEISVIEKNYEKIKTKKSNHKENTTKSSKQKKYNKKKKSTNYKRNVSSNYGKNAGKIWNKLNNNGPLNQSSLLKETDLSSNDFYAAIGWLARENKIYKDSNSYRLGNTNLTNEIGENAGRLWRMLDSEGKANLSSICEYTDMKIKDVYLAIGWLSRENKIKLIHNNKQIYYKLA